MISSSRSTFPASCGDDCAQVGPETAAAAADPRMTAFSGRVTYDDMKPSLTRLPLRRPP